MSTLPKCVEDLILDYYWSYKTYCLRIRLNREFFHTQLTTELVRFWNVMPYNWSTLLFGPYALV